MKTEKYFIKIFNLLLAKISGLKIGQGSLIEGGLYLRGAKNIEIGESAYISYSVSLKTSQNSRIIIGKNALIRDGVRIQGGKGTLKIGDNFSINHNSSITFDCDIEIGNNVMIAPGVIITPGGHGILAEKPMREQPAVTEKIIIENDVWIGAGAVILKGVSVKEGTVVAAGAVVTKDTEPYSIVAGIPAKKIDSRKKGENQ